MKIPLIIHQIYEGRNGEKPTPLLEKFAKSWTKKNPDWKYQFWNYQLIDNFLGMHFPEYIPIYQSFKYDVQRWDFIRYLILYHYGGLYVDIDYECLEPIDNLLKKMDCYLGVEPVNPFDASTTLIGNAFLASVPKFDFWNYVIQKIIHHKYDINDNKKIYILKSTGPLMITDAYQAYNEKLKIELLPASLVTPLTLQEVREMLAGNFSKPLEEKIEKAYAIHYFWGSWW